MSDKNRRLKFEPGAMSIIQMGEELIGHPSTALNEIVKNSYDADADKCWVYTQYDKDISKSFLVIKDNGLGMSQDILFGDWLRPSVSSKRNSERDKRRSAFYNRRFLGSKGIGRLASMALGRYLTVVSKKNNENEYNWLRIDREKFKVEDLLDNITFSGGTIKDYIELFNSDEYLDLDELSPNGNLINILKNELFGGFQEGTMIVLEYLDESVQTIIENEINNKELEETSFFKSLSDLITPLKLNSELQSELVDRGIISEILSIDNGESTFELFYGINFIVDKIKSKIDFFTIEASPILKHYDYRIFGKANQDASVEGRYICQRFEDDKRDDELRISASYSLSDENIAIRRLPDVAIPAKYKDSNVGEFYFDIRVYDLDGDAKDKMVEVLKVGGRREATSIFSKYLGLKISKNGFGVKPYGDEDKDWLGLGAKRVQKHIETIGPNQIIGNVFLFSPQNDTLNEKTNREGFFENKAFIIFKKILDGILEESGRRRAKYREYHNLGRSTKSKHQRPDAEKFIQYILNSTNDKTLISKSQSFVKETITALDNMENSLSFSQRLASLGTGLELVYHELAQPITSIGGSVKGVEINAAKINDNYLKEKIQHRIDNISDSLIALDTLKESLQPAIGKSMAKSFKPIDTFNKVCYLFKEIFEDKGIILEISSNLENYTIKDYEFVLWISFLNIMNNAVYWLNFSDKKKIIVLDYNPHENQFVISNTGPLIPEEDLEIIFNYGVTGKKEKNATGLGLAFTRNMLEMRNWQIWAENRNYGPAFFIKKNPN